MILVTKNNCKNCEYVKSKIPDGLELTIINTDKMSSEEMAILAYHELLDSPVPVLILDNDKIVTGTVKIKNILQGC